MGLLIDERARQLERVGVVQCREHVVLARLPQPLVELALHVLANVCAKGIRPAFLDTESGHELVVDLGQLERLDFVHPDLEARLLAGNGLGAIVLRKLDLGRLFLARSGADQGHLEVREHLVGAEHDLDVLALAAFEGFLADRSGEIDDHAIAVRGAAVDRLPRALLLPEPLDHVVDIAVPDADVGCLERELVDLLELDLGIDLEGRAIGEMLVVGRGQRFDRRSPGRIQLLLGDGMREGRANHVADDLLPDLTTVALAHDLGRHLAGTKALEPGRLAHLPEPEIDFAIDVRVRHAHGDLTPQPLGGLN